MEGSLEAVTNAVLSDFADIRDIDRLVHVAVRLLFAALLGGILGFQREMAGKDAGLRTHMLIAVSAALFIVVPQLEDFHREDVSRVLQGLLAGLGFLGGGAILKVADERTIHGLTTATGIWLTAGVGIAVGFGRIGTAMLATGLAFLILGGLGRFESVYLKSEPSD
jgi:putative Mg2+ transporter-C (MgtC) family protein